MVPEVVEAIATYVGLIRDLLLLLILLIILIVVVFVFQKVMQLLRAINELVQKVNEAVDTVSDSIVRPAASGSGVAFGLGKVFAFLRGARRS